MIYAELIRKYKKQRIKSLYDNKFDVEYGTGVVGEGTHEDPKNYQYDINGHGENGWWFFDDKGKIHWTKGMKAHRFMYQATVDYITTGYKDIFKKLFDKKIGVIFK